jgi:thymidylate synthase (FAD)
MIIVKPDVSLEWITAVPLLVIERAGRVCYKSEDRIVPGSAEKFAHMIDQRGHESVVEHACASFRIVCDRGVSHEIVRHRIASFSQSSTRYCNYSKAKFGSEISVIEPPGLDQMQRSTWAEAIRCAEEGYMNMIAQGCSPQIARSVLPTCLVTELVMTANFREWRHFLKLRTSAAAHPQMREIASMIEEILAHECPVIFGQKEIV